MEIQVKSFLVTVVVALVFFLAIIFGARNEQLVTISYFVAKGEYRLPVVLAVVFLLGFIISWVFAGYHILKLRLNVRQLSKRLALAETKNNNDVDA